MVGVGVKVTLSPAQIVVAVPEMVTDGVNKGFTVMIILLDVPVLGLAHVSLEVNIQVMVSLFANVLLLYVAPVPTFTPLFFHW